MDNRGFLFMFYGFSAVWLGVIAYAVFLHARASSLRADLDRLKEIVGST